MSDLDSVLIRLPGGRRVEAVVRSHVVVTDQPVDNGGADAAPSPFELFLASIGTCAGIFVQGFCAKRGLDFTGITLLQTMTRDDQGTVRGVTLTVQVPPSFPERYHSALVAVVDQCTVKKTIAASPTFSTNVVVAR